MQETWPYFVLLWISEEHKAAHLRIFSAIIFCHLYIDSKFCIFLFEMVILKPSSAYEKQQQNEQKPNAHVN